MDEKEIFQKLMKKQMAEGPIRDMLVELKLKPTYGNGIFLQMVKKAAEGDLSAAKYILGAVQEEPEQTVAADLSQVPTEELKRMLNAECRMQN